MKKLSRKPLVATVLLCVISSSIVEGIRVTESDISITEGSTRQIGVQRQQNLASSMSLTVFVTTIEGYKQRTQANCSKALSTLLGGDESRVDPAEDGDLTMREYNLQYAREQNEASLTLEVVDDSIAENEETFIIYTSVIENPGDDCARAVRLRDNDVVQFNFSTPELRIGEGEYLPSRLSIVKNGQNEPNISFQVTVSPESSDDYDSNANHTYVFTNETNELPVATQLKEDRYGENIETFFIDLPTRYSLPIARSVDPIRATVNIVDDDSVLLGFEDSNSTVTLTEGGPAQTVCIDIKPIGLLVDPLDYIPLELRTESIDSEVQFGSESLAFNGGNTITCRTIIARDDDVSDGIQTSQLFAERQQGTTVTVVFDPPSIPITIMDNDVISFELADNTEGTPQAPPRLVEGDSIQNFLKIMKSGLTNFAYYVTLKVEALTNLSDPSKITMITPVTFGVSDSEVDVSLAIADNQLPEKEMRYRISIASIEPFKPGNDTSLSKGALTNVAGVGIELLVYDNDFNVSFPSSSVRVAEGSSETICVMINGLDVSGINPMLRIPLGITIENTSSIGGLNVSTRQIILSSLSHNVCFEVAFPADNDECDSNTRSFTLQLVWTPDPEYTVIFHHRNITIEIDDAQDCASAVCVACIAVPVVIIIIIIAVLLVAAAILVWWRRKNEKRYYPQDKEKENNLNKGGGSGLTSTDSFAMSTPPGKDPS